MRAAKRPWKQEKREKGHTRHREQTDSCERFLNAEGDYGRLFVKADTESIMLSADVAMNWPGCRAK
jgi:hypothetical protein